jgi:hypothetical protein
VGIDLSLLENLFSPSLCFPDYFVQNAMLSVGRPNPQEPAQDRKGK